mgnify:CR=1 FL=1
MKQYTHLNQTERTIISNMKASGQKLKAIAQAIGRSTSTISRELRRNCSLRGYRPKRAQVLSDIRAQSNRNAKRISVDILNLADQYLCDDWSPEQIAATLPISHTTLYSRIRTDKSQGGQLYKHLRQCNRKRRKSYGKSYSTRGQILNRRDISERPTHVETREELGHWEGDTVIGANHKQALVTLVERKTGFTLIAKVEHKTAQLVRQACIKLLTPFKDHVHTITFDNGKEFAEHALIDQSIGCTTYFAKPYSSWQRGSNENTNGLIRQYIPKKTSLIDISQQFLDTIMFKLNNRPRKRHGFIAPIVLFNKIALRT